MQLVEAVALGIEINLASTLLVAGARRLREEAVGDAQERALKEVSAGATAAMLVEMARYTHLERNLLRRLEEQFGAFFTDRWVAEALVGVALGSAPPPPRRRRWRSAAGPSRRR